MTEPERAYTLPERVYTLKEVAQVAGFTVATLRRYIKQGYLKAIQRGYGKRGRCEYRVSREEIRRVFGA